MIILGCNSYNLAFIRCHKGKAGTENLSHTHKESVISPIGLWLVGSPIGHFLDSGMSVVKDGHSSQSERRDGKVLIFRQAKDVVIEQEGVYGSSYWALQHRCRWMLYYMQWFSFPVEERSSAPPSTKLLPKWNMSRLAGAATQTKSCHVVWQQTHEGEAFPADKETSSTELITAKSKH